MSTLFNTDAPQMRAITDAERAFLMLAWTRLEDQISTLKRHRDIESPEERMLTDDEVGDNEKLIDLILWCFPEVRMADSSETFRIDQFPVRKKPRSDRRKHPVWVVFQQVEQSLGKSWCQTARENIDKRAA